MSNKELRVISDYAKQIAQEHAISEAKAKQIIELFINQIKSDVNFGIDVRLNNFGTFKLAKRAARAERQGRNPQTGEALTIAAQPEKQVITFKQSKVSK